MIGSRTWYAESILPKKVKDIDVHQTKNPGENYVDLLRDVNYGDCVGMRLGLWWII